jgi:hypothetical protein
MKSTKSKYLGLNMYQESRTEEKIEFLDVSTPLPFLVGSRIRAYIEKAGAALLTP